MKIQNFRLGFATNSSSTHSIVWAPKKGGMFNRLSDDDVGYYGWNDFTLTSVEAKKDYVASLLVSHHKTEEDILRVANMFGLPNTWYPTDIDHQSIILLPELGEENIPPLAKVFRDELIEWLERDDVVIFGGNDNSDGHPAHYEYPMVPVEHILDITCKALFGIKGWRSSDVPKVRYDNGEWVVFTSDWDGNPMKIRWTFKPEDGDFPKSAFPELVDLKITDYCPYGCKYCYQGSTTKGKHAPFETLERIAKELATLGCFEVALGGGEPTLHPQFREILHMFDDYGILVNFTTRNVTSLTAEESVLKDPKFKGHVAVSVETGTAAEAVQRKIHDAHGYGAQNRIVFHYVMGSSPVEEMTRIIKEGNTTLLGYKTTGFGLNFQPHDYSDWRDYLDDALKGDGLEHTVGIDTALAVQSDMSGIPPHLYYTDEGRFSFYIDAVANTFAPSSFCQPKMGNTDCILPLGSIKEAWASCPALRGSEVIPVPKTKTRLEIILGEAN